jgi:hypothetical protein
MIALNDVQGLWRRSLMAWPDGRRDTATSVKWAQGPSLFGDLRVPAQRPDFSDSSCLNALSMNHMRWLATQAGFAGRLVFDGRFFEWHRSIDYQPPKASSDAARLWFENGMLIEEGRYSPYIEHWHRDEKEPKSLSGALRLTDLDTGVAGLLVCAGQHFIYARDRAQKLAPGGTLSDLIASAQPDDARALINCEISFGRITQSDWRIAASSLPYREGAELLPALSKDMTHFTSADIQADGAPMTRRWSVIEIDGDITGMASTMASVINSYT